MPPKQADRNGRKIATENLIRKLSKEERFQALVNKFQQNRFNQFQHSTVLRTIEQVRQYRNNQENPSLWHEFLTVEANRGRTLADYQQLREDAMSRIRYSGPTSVATLNQTVTVSPGTDSLKSAWESNPDAKVFELAPGDHHFTLQFNVDRSDTVIRAQDPLQKPDLYQTDDSQNLLNIVADGVTLDGLVLHMEDSVHIALTYAGVSNTVVRNCVIYGSEVYFGIYVAGPDFSQGQETLDGFASNQLGDGNQFIGNEVYSGWWGDSFAFALQKNGLVQHNKIVGGKLAVYLCRDCVVKNNVITDSVSQGIWVSTPSSGNVVQQNFISGVVASGIKISKNLEHPSESYYRGAGDSIARNYVSHCGFFGIEINDSDNLLITRNTLDFIDFVGIYLGNSDGLVVSHNRVYNSEETNIYYENVWNFPGNINSNIRADYQVSNCLIEKNRLYGSVYPDQAPTAGVMITNFGNSGITVRLNHFFYHYQLGNIYGDYERMNDYRNKDFLQR
jgi:hypothetical protein